MILILVDGEEGVTWGNALDVLVETETESK